MNMRQKAGVTPLHEATRDRSAPRSYSAVILYYKLGMSVVNTVEMLVHQSMPPDRIIIVDNNSADGVAADVCVSYEQCELVSLPENLGYAGGMAAGIERLGDTCSHILLLTHEVHLEQSCAEQLMLAMRDRSDLVLTGPVLTLGAEGPVWSLGGKFGKLGTVDHISKRDDRATVEWLDGACLLVVREALSEIGGFDTDYFVYWEDVDVSVRLAALGQIACIHSAHASQGTSLAPTYFKSRNQIMFWRKQRRFSVASQAVLMTMAKIVFRDLPRGDLRTSRARAYAIMHGFTGKLSMEFKDVRVQ